MLADGRKADIHKFRYGQVLKVVKSKFNHSPPCGKRLPGKPPPPEKKNNLESILKKKEIAHD